MYLNIEVRCSEEYPPDETPNVISVEITDTILKDIKEAHQKIVEMGRDDLFSDINSITFFHYGAKWYMDEMEDLGCGFCISPNRYEGIYTEHGETPVEITMECNVLHVTERSFRFDAFLKHTNLRYESDSIPISAIIDIEKRMEQEKLAEETDRITEEVASEETIPAITPLCSETLITVSEQKLEAFVLFRY